MHLRQHDDLLRALPLQPPAPFLYARLHAGRPHHLGRSGTIERILWRFIPTWNRHLADGIAHRIDGTIEASTLHVSCPEDVTKYALVRGYLNRLFSRDILLPIVAMPP